MLDSVNQYGTSLLGSYGWAVLWSLLKIVALVLAAAIVGQAEAASIAVRFTSLAAVHPGQYATAAVATRARASCTIVVTYKSGRSTAAGLGTKTASSAGRVSWTWKVGTRTTRGSWPVKVTCRYGGDEFIILMPRRSRPGALETTRRLRRTLNQTALLHDEGLSIQVTASYGIASLPEDAQDREQLLIIADRAMFSSKGRGRDRIARNRLIRRHIDQFGRRCVFHCQRLARRRGIAARIRRRPRPHDHVALRATARVGHRAKRDQRCRIAVVGRARRRHRRRLIRSVRYRAVRRAAAGPPRQLAHYHVHPRRAGDDRPGRLEAKEAGKVPVLEDPDERPERRGDRQRVHHERLERQGRGKQA